MIKIITIVLGSLHFLFAQNVVMQDKYNLFYSVSYFEQRTINPIYGNTYVDGLRANELMYSRLWTWTKDISEVSDLVEGVTHQSFRSPFNDTIELLSTASGGGRWRVKIRSGLRWPDGQPLTTEDIKFTFDVYKTTGSEYKDLFEKIKKIEIIDAQTIEFFVDQKDIRLAPYILILAQILPEHKIITKSLSKKSEFSNSPMGSGPFQFVPQDKRIVNDRGHDKTVFERNPYYYDPGRNPNISGVKIMEEPNLSTRLNKLIIPNRKENWSTLDFELNVPVDPANYNSLENQSKHLVRKTYKSNSWYGIAFNCDIPILQNRKIRLAISYAINIDNHINTYYTKVNIGGQYEPITHRITGPYNPLWGYGDNSIQPIKYNKDKAKNELDINGVKFANGVSYFNGEPIKLKLIYNKGKNRHGSAEQNVLEYIIRDLSQAGLEVKAVGLDTKYFNERLTTGDYDMVFQQIEMGYGSDIAPLFTKDNKLNVTHFSDPILTNYLQKFKISRSKQKALISKKIHKYIYDQAPYIFLYRLDKIMAYRDVLETNNNIVPKYIFTHINEWYFKD